jgi:sarcosine oxidase
VRLAQQVLPLWRELEDESGRLLLDITGGVDYGHPDSVEAVAAGLAAAGAPYVLLKSGEASERWPGMRFSGEVLFQPDAGRARADDTLRALQDRATGNGAELRFSQPALEIKLKGDEAVVHTDDGDFVAPVAVVTCGPWASKLLAGLVRLPSIEVTQEQVFHFRPVDNSAWPAFIHHRRPFIYGLEAPEGVKVAEHHNGVSTDADSRDFVVDAGARARVRGYVEDWMPGLEPVPVTETTCLYSTTPTDDFVLDRVGPLVVGAGFSGHGFKFTPLVGRILADLAEGDRASTLARFSLRTE